MYYFKPLDMCTFKPDGLTTFSMKTLKAARTSNRWTLRRKAYVYANKKETVINVTFFYTTVLKWRHTLRLKLLTWCICSCIFVMMCLTETRVYTISTTIRYTLMIRLTLRYQYFGIDHTVTSIVCTAWLIRYLQLWC